MHFIIERCDGHRAYGFPNAMEANIAEIGITENGIAENRSERFISTLSRVSGYIVLAGGLVGMASMILHVI